jgi:hypothetical protein
MDEGLGFVFSESQGDSVVELDMELEKQASMTKEDFSLLSTTLDGIVNSINVLSNEVMNRTGIIVKKLEEMMGHRAVQKREQAVQTKRPPVKREAPDTDPC